MKRARRAELDVDANGFGSIDPVDVDGLEPVLHAEIDVLMGLASEPFDMRPGHPRHLQVRDDAERKLDELRPDHDAGAVVSPFHDPQLQKVPEDQR